MKLNKRSTVLLTVFVIGLIALAADRTILRPQGGPRAASAASEPTDSGLLADNLPVLEDERPEAGVAERLDDLWSGKEPAFEQSRNPFALPATWLEVNAVGTPLPDAVARFIRTHRLTAVVRDGENSYVLVDDRFLLPGQTLDGFTLVSVGDRVALFTGAGRQAVLELAGEDGNR